MSKNLLVFKLEPTIERVRFPAELHLSKGSERWIR